MFAPCAHPSSDPPPVAHGGHQHLSNGAGVPSIGQATVDSEWASAGVPTAMPWRQTRVSSTPLPAHAHLTPCFCTPPLSRAPVLHPCTGCLHPWHPTFGRWPSTEVAGSSQRGRLRSCTTIHVRTVQVAHHVISSSPHAQSHAQSRDDSRKGTPPGCWLGKPARICCYTAHTAAEATKLPNI